jgi:hypothetical protein
MRTFYAHFNSSTGKINSIGPLEMNDDFPNAEVMELDQETAFKFFHNEYSMADWYIIKTGGNWSLTRNPIDAEPVDVGQMIEITRINNEDLKCVLATLSVPDSVIEISIPRECIGKPLNVVKAKELFFILTKKNDPSHIVDEFTISVTELIEKGKVIIPIKTEFRDYSLFTRSEFKLYRFDISLNGRGILHRPITTRINKLTEYKIKKNAKTGVKVTVNGEKNTLDFEILGSTKVSWPNVAMCPVFITKRHDPTVVYGQVTLNMDAFLENKKISLQLPKDLPGEFGLASYPLADTMTFVKVNNDTST